MHIFVNPTYPYSQAIGEQEFIQTTSQFQVRSEKLKSQISISSKIQETKIQNFDYQQDLRMKKLLDLTANESKIHLQYPNLH